MSSDRILLVLAIVCLLGLGVFVSQGWSRPEGITGSGLEGLWRERRADLLIQLGLLFVAALGIRALLPGEDEVD